MNRREQILPEGRLYILTWNLPRTFGGMTGVVLHRAAEFARADRRRVEILTMTPDLHPARALQLRVQGHLGRGVRVRNLWRDLRSWGPAELAEMRGTVECPDGRDAPGSPQPRGSPQPDAEADSDMSTRTSRHGIAVQRRLDDGGALLQEDRFRRDGTLLLSDRRDVRRRGQPGGRRLTLFARDGEVLAQWRSEREFWHAYLDAVTCGETSTVISDHTAVGGMVHDYRRDGVLMVQVLHNPHLKDPSGGAPGVLNRGKAPIITHLDSYDLVTTLTEEHRRDLLDDSLAADNVMTVSNMVRPVFRPGKIDRDPRRGVMAVRLAGQKRVDHAVRALARLDEASSPFLDIFGTGAEEQTLRKLLTDLALEGRVALRGHSGNMPREFRRASFSVLSSRYEGQGLVLMESMAAGCIPVAYDISYGPSSLVDDGVTGFLVPDGDIGALAEAIRRVTTLDPAALARMRRAAIARAREFAAEAGVRAWADALREAWRSKGPARCPDGTARLIGAEQSRSGVELEVGVEIAEGEALPGGEAASEAEAVEGPERVLLTWLGRSSQRYGRAPAHWQPSERGLLVRGTLPDAVLDQAEAGEMLDLYVDVLADGNPVRLRIAADRAVLPDHLDGIELCSTNHGNLSARIGKRG
ncbi:glycosyltransferase [Brevibacterium album]|uniref:glycosyltransferase n=1 Tax=Brevibacterium album TaxID=417948 RepID=UPI000491EFAA|nr:glycosyltransferase [Brevibacterium album]